MTVRGEFQRKKRVAECQCPAKMKFVYVPPSVQRDA